MLEQWFIDYFAWFTEVKIEQSPVIADTGVLKITLLEERNTICPIRNSQSLKQKVWIKIKIAYGSAKGGNQRKLTQNLKLTDGHAESLNKIVREA